MSSSERQHLGKSDGGKGPPSSADGSAVLPVLRTARAHDARPGPAKKRKRSWRGAALALLVVACELDDRVVTDSQQPTARAAELGACAPGTSPTSCEGGLRLVCTAEGRWVQFVCESGAGGSGSGTVGAGASGGAGTNNAGAGPAAAGGSAPGAAAGGAAGGSSMAASATIPAAGSAGSAMAAGAGGAEPAAAPPVASAAPLETCSFEYLGDWVRCENSEYPNLVATSADDLETCQQLCLMREDCTGVIDWLWLENPDLGCSLYVSTCNAPAFVSWGEEDGGHEYQRSCTTAAP